MVIALTFKKNPAVWDSTFTERSVAQTLRGPAVA